MVLTYYQLHQILSEMNGKLSELNHHFTADLLRLDTNLKLHQKDTEFHRTEILERLTAVEKTLKELQDSIDAVPKTWIIASIISAITSPAMIKIGISAALIIAGYSMREIGQIMHLP